VGVGEISTSLVSPKRYGNKQYDLQYDYLGG
jgi:hypothetical protein